MRTPARLAMLSLPMFLACARTSTSSATPQEVRPVAAGNAAAAGGGAAAAPAQRRQPVHPARMDTLRKAAVAEVMASIRGRENEPAGRVFKNVRLFKEMPAREFLVMMDEQYGRGLSFLCTNCHTDDKNWADDTRKNKVIARQMERMQRDLDVKYLKKVKLLDEEIPKVTCVMCHRGTPHMPNTMDVPAAPVPQRKRG